MNPPDPTLDSPLAPDVSAESPSTVSLDRTRTPDVSPDPVAVDSADSVPGYEILGELGRGGMGVVYRARQTALSRVVALKMVLGAHRAEQKELTRFLAEAEAVAAVRHPNVVQVFEYGEHGGRPFMALEFLAGGTLSRRLKRHGAPLPPAEAAAVVEQVARGVAAAHDAGIVHRDLKPGNILLADPPAAESLPAGGRHWTGNAKVADFGLAKQLGQQELTATGAVMGTPAYMAPEQASGRTKFVGPPADVYALGVILYEALTATRPFDGDDSWALLQRVVNEQPESPRRRLPSVPRDLELICLKCLRKDPGDRYPTATELADDLQRYLDGKPVSARPLGAISRAWRWCRWNRAVAVLLATVFVVLAAGGIASTLFALDAVAEAGAKTKALEKLTAESKAREKADAGRLLESRTALYGRDIRDAFDGLAVGDADQLRKALDAAPADLRGWEWRHLNGQATAMSEVLPDAVPGGEVEHAWPSTDGRWVALTGRGADGVPKARFHDWVAVWDARPGGRPVVLPDHPPPPPPGARADAIQQVLFLGGTRVAVLRLRTFRVWDFAAPDRRPIEGRLRPDLESVQHAAVSADGKRMGVLARMKIPLPPKPKTVQQHRYVTHADLYDLATGAAAGTSQLPEDDGMGHRLAPTLDRVLYVRSRPPQVYGDLCRWTFGAERGELIKSFPRDINAVHLGPDGKQVLIATFRGDGVGVSGSANRVEWWADWTGAGRKELPHERMGHLAVAAQSPGQAEAVLGSVWEWPASYRNSELVVWTPAARESVRTVRLDPESVLLAATGEWVYLLDPPTGDREARVVRRVRARPPAGAHWVARTKHDDDLPQGGAVVSDRAMIWTPRSDGGRELRRAGFVGGAAEVVVRLPDDTFWFGAVLADRAGGRVAVQLSGSPDDGTTDWAGGVLVHDLTGNRTACRIRTKAAATFGGIDLSADGGTVAVGAGGRSGREDWTRRGQPVAELYDATTGQLARRLTADGCATGVALSPDGKRVAVACYLTDPNPDVPDRGELTVFDTATGGVALAVPFTEQVFGLAFSPDGARLLATGTGRLWEERDQPRKVFVLDAASGAVQKVLALPPPRDGVFVMAEQFRPAFSPDGARLAVGGETGTTLWDTATFQQVAVLPDGAWKVQFTPDGKRLLGVGLTGIWVRSAGD